MRRVSIVVSCDVCQEPIVEEAEGDSTLRFTARGEAKEMEICDDCLHGTFLQEARPAANRKKRKKGEEFPCEHCEKSFGTQRGLSHHQTKMHP